MIIFATNLHHFSEKMPKEEGKMAKFAGKIPTKV